MSLALSPLTEASLKEGVQTLCSRDPDLAAVVTQFGLPPLWAREPGFPTLIHIILEQQVSLASARAAYERLCAAVSPLTPAGFLELDEIMLKTIGFSRQKAKYGQLLARAILAGELDLARVETLADHTAQAELVKIKGIGPWTANIYLLMALRRPDIWPSGDLALAIAVQQVKQFASRPTPTELDRLSAAWQPWRAVAARLFWHHYLSSRANR